MTAAATRAHDTGPDRTDLDVARTVLRTEAAGLQALAARLDGAFAEAAFRFLPVRAKLDIAGFGEDDIFSH